jgi:hypothetical protein
MLNFSEYGINYFFFHLRKGRPCQKNPPCYKIKIEDKSHERLKSRGLSPSTTYKPPPNFLRWDKFGYLPETNCNEENL